MMTSTGTRWRSTGGPSGTRSVHLVARPDYLDLNASTGLWVRPVDVGATLSARRFGMDGRVTFELTDSFAPWERGSGVAKRSNGRPDLRLDVQALGAACLGGFSFAELARAVKSTRRRAAGSTGRTLFGSDRAPWCPEIF